MAMSDVTAEDVNGNVNVKANQISDGGGETTDDVATVAETLAIDNESDGYRVLKTILSFFGAFAGGMGHKLLGTAMLDILERMDTNYEDLSTAMAMRHVFRMLGSFVTGYLFDKFRRQRDLIVVVMAFIFAASLIVQLWVTSTEMLGVCYAIFGFATGGQMTAIVATTLNIWHDKANTYLLLVYMGPPLGRFLTPLFTVPFLGSASSSRHHVSNASLPSTSRNISSEWIPSRIEVPFAIISGALLVYGLPFIWFYVTSRKNITERTEEKRKSLKETLDPGTCADGKRFFGLFMGVGVVLYFTCIRGQDEPISSYTYTYVITGGLDVSTTEAAWLDSMQGICLSVSRGITAILGKCIPIRYLVLPSLVLSNGAAIGLCRFGTESRALLWTFLVLNATTVNAAWPGAIAWVDRYVETTGIMSGFPEAGIGLGGFLSQIIVGWTLENYSVVYVMYVSLMFGGGSTTVMVAMHSVACFYGDRYKRRSREEVTDEVVVRAETKIDDDGRLC